MEMGNDQVDKLAPLQLQKEETKKQQTFGDSGIQHA